MTDEQLTEATFCVFTAPWWGIRAMAIILRAYQTKHGLKTLRDILNRWAPPADDNPTSNYVEYVAKDWRDPDLPLDLTDYRTLETLIRRIVLFENGEDPYTQEYQIGLILAGIEPPPITYT
jgi:hypothetical protein